MEVVTNEQDEAMRQNSWQRSLAIAASTAALVVGLAACNDNGSKHEVGPTPTTAGNQVHLLDGTWNFMPGVTPQKGKLLVSRTGEAILNYPEDTFPNVRSSKYLPNSPVNLYGTHLEMQQPGNIRITTHLSDINGPASLSFLSQPPVRYDERIVVQPGVTVTVDGNKASVGLRSREGEPAATQIVSLARPDGLATIELTQDGNETTVKVNDQTVAFGESVLANQVWFGIDAGQSFTVDKLNAEPLRQNKLSAVDMSKAYANVKRAAKGLVGTAASHGHADMNIGTAVDLGPLMSDPQYAEFVLQNFNEIETEMAGKFQAIHPEEGNYQFGELDALVTFANEHNMKVRGHALIFGEAYPQWLQQKLAHSTPDQARAVMKDHITTVMQRYDGKHGHGLITSWDVVNEPFDGINDYSQLQKQNIWYKALGPDYISEAFRFARAANPDALLGLNDTAIESDVDKRNAVLHRSKGLAAKNLLDYVGFQAHYYDDDLADTDIMNSLNHHLADYFKQFERLGLKVRISEASVAGSKPKQQAAVYSRLFQTCLKDPKCLDFNMWGATNSEVSDFYMTGDQLSQDPGDDAPTRQTANGTIIFKPAWTDLLKTASQR